MSYLLHENECLINKGRPDINALLSQFINEFKLNPNITASYRKVDNYIPLDIDELSIGANYVTIKVDIIMQKQ